MRSLYVVEVKHSWLDIHSLIVQFIGASCGMVNSLHITCSLNLTALGYALTKTIISLL